MHLVGGVWNRVSEYKWTLKMVLYKYFTRERLIHPMKVPSLSDKECISEACAGRGYLWVQQLEEAIHTRPPAIIVRSTRRLSHTDTRQSLHALVPISATVRNIQQSAKIMYLQTPLPVRRGLTLELHFLVTRYGGLCLPFRGITRYLHGLVSLYECPIIAGRQVWMAYSTAAYASLLLPLSCLHENSSPTLSVHFRL